MPQHPAGADTQASTAKQRFLQSMDARIDALLSALLQLEQATEDPLLRRQLERRLQAMADVSTTLGLDQLSAAFTSAEACLASANDGARTARAIEEVRCTLELVPTLTSGGPRTSAVSRRDTVPSAPEPAERLPSTFHDVLTPGEVQPPTRHEVVVLGTMPLRKTAQRCADVLPHVNVQFTVDEADAQSMATACTRPAFVLDARRPDAGREFHILSEFGPCILVEANAKQRTVFERQGAHLALLPGDDLAPALHELFEPTPVKTLPAPPPAPTLPPPAQAAPSSQAASAVAEAGIARRTAIRNPSADVVNLPTRTILIADADAAMSWFMTGVLRSARVNVLEARDGAEALALAQERHPDLVISDVSLSGLDGYGLCRNIKRDVVLCDTPVLLVSWKEEQLQRVRELGAGADGYFVKEADSATILRRCAEVLAPRANVEQRLRNEATVHGRLEGMTPWTVLRLVCDIVGNARVTFADAGYRHVVVVGDGRLLTAQRETAEGRLETGEPILASLLGMRAGKFVVEADGSAVQPAFFGSMTATLSPHVSRIRRALRVLQGDALHRIARLELDAVVFRPYAEASPNIVRRAIEKLTEGVPPFSLTRSISAGLLESVLLDLALRGAFTQAIDMHGHDLLDDADIFRQPFDLELRTPTAGFDLVVAPGAPRVTRDSSESDVEQAARFAVQSDPSDALSPPMAEPATDIPTPMPDDLGPPERHQLQAPTSEPVPAPESRRKPKFEIGFAVEADAVAEDDEACRPLSNDSVPPQAQPAPAITVAPAELELSDALLGSLAPTPTPGPSHGRKPTPGRSAATETPHRTTPDSKLLVASRFRDTFSEDGMVEEDDPLFAALHAAESSPPPRPTPSREDATTPRRVRVPRPSVQLRAAQLGVQARQASARAVGWVRQKANDWRPPRAAVDATPSVPPAAPVGVHNAATTKPTPTPSSALLPSLPPDAGLPPDASVPPDAGLPPDASVPAKPAPRSARIRRLATIAKRSVLPAAAALGAAALAFAGMGALVERIQTDREAVLAAAPVEIAQAARALEDLSNPAQEHDLGPPDAVDSEVAPPTARAPIPHQEMRSSELPLPEGVSLGPGRGLLEINTGDGHRIYVDGLFIGRGPVRRVPLDAGAHEVELRVDGEIDKFDIDIVAARRTRLEPASHAALTK